jgi:hypothetical protein
MLFIRYSVVSLTCFFYCYTLSSQTIKGSIQSQDGIALGFAGIFIVGSNKGTTANEAGHFELKLDSSGVYKIGVTLLGYKTHTEEVTLQKNETQKITIQLKDQAYEISEVQIGINKEDPAYPIMRHAIAHRKIYLEEVKAYECRVYIKGMQRITHVPKRVLMMKVPEDVQPGIVYLSESLSQLYVQPPNQVKEELISSKVSGDNRAFTFNRAGAIRFNVYENVLPSYGLNQRGFISPLANNAMMYYDYKLVGEIREGQYTVFKIKLLPKRKHDPAFRGHIYIIKDLWRVHSTDLYLDKSNNIEYVDTLKIVQEYKQLENGIWMPTAQRFIFNLEILGFRGNGYFVALYSNYKAVSRYNAKFYGLKELDVKQDLSMGSGKKQQKVVKNQKKDALAGTDTIQSIFPKNFFDKEILTVPKGANQLSDSAWDALRPVALSEEEQADYAEKDSIAIIEENKDYKDSIDRISNKYRPSNLYLNSYTYTNSYRNISFTIRPLTATLQYNTIEGFVVSPNAEIKKELEENIRYLIITPEVRYGKASQQFYAKLNGKYIYNAPLNRTISAEGGMFVKQFNQDEPISVFLNTTYSLFNEQNFMRLYQSRYASLKWQSEVTNGLRIEVGSTYENRTPLANNSNFTLYRGPSRPFMPNELFINGSYTNFAAHTAWIQELDISYVHGQRYINRPDMRIRFRSKYPTFKLSYRMARPIAGSNANFDMLEAGFKWLKPLKIYGSMRFEAYSGFFPNTSQAYIQDLKHFEGNQTHFSRRFDRFELLDYYLLSTTNAYSAIHFRHHFNGFWFNKVPILRKLKWQEVLSINYLNTSASGNYFELGVGIEHIFKIFRIDFYQAYGQDVPYMQGIRLGFGM